MHDEKRKLIPPLVVELKTSKVDEKNKMNPLINTSINIYYKLGKATGSAG